MIDGKKLGEAGFRYLGVPYDDMDCQKFVEQCLKDCGDNTDLGGSNSWFRECMKNGWVGTPEECKSQFGFIPVGAFLFILEPVSSSTPGKFRDDGVGDATHIGIVTGTGEGAIHSSHSRGCVCESKFMGKTVPNGGWNRVGLWNRVDYGLSNKDKHEDNDMVATVHSENGGPVKMRANPSTSCKLYWDVPNGSTVVLVDRDDKWSKIIWDGLTGYMMTNFLVQGETPTVDPITGDTITVSREGLMKVYNLIGNMLNT